jgi:hypothetical protein
MEEARWGAVFPGDTSKVAHDSRRSLTFHAIYQYRYTIIDTVGELLGAESGSLLRRKSSEVRRSGLLRFYSCYEVIQAKKVNSCSNKRML